MEKTPFSEENLELAIIKVGDLTCGIDTSVMKEINKLYQITPIHGAAEYIRGVINLRGQIVTVLDLRARFALEPCGENARQQIVVVACEDEDIGLLVDSVEEVVPADKKNMEPPPSNVGEVTGAFFTSILKTENDLVAVLKLGEIIKIEESGPGG